MWGELLAKESREKIEKARMMQRAEDVRYKNLHSQLLTSNILFVLKRILME